MQIDKNQIIQLLKSLGRHDDADRARSEMPNSVDSDRGGAGGLMSKAKNLFKR